VAWIEMVGEIMCGDQPVPSGKDRVVVVLALDDRLQGLLFEVVVMYRSNGSV